MLSDGRFYRWGLALATLLAGVLRFAWLGSVPAALYCDEALHGYEAWSLLTTGRDRHGVLLPFVFDVFGIGWSEPLYIYLTVPAVALFGATPLAARFVAAASGTLAVPVAGLMTTALLSAYSAHGARGGRVRESGARVAGLAAAFLMATSPWAVHFSRIGFQASLLPLLFGVGFWMAATALRSDASHRGARFIAAAAALGLTLHTYPTARLAMPLLVTAFVWTHRRQLAGQRRLWLPAAAVMAALLIPVAAFSLTERGWRRFANLSVATAMPGTSMPGRAAALAGNYLTYYSPRFLITEGDPNPRHGVPGHGVLHPHEALLAILGLVACARSRSPGGRFLLCWILLFPAAAALTVDPRHAVRALVALPGLYAVAGAGVAQLAAWWRERPRALASRAAAAAMVVLGLMAAWSTSIYANDYFTRWPITSAQAFQYGLRETYDYLKQVSAGHDSIYVTLNEDEPWIQLVYYQGIPPEHYQRTQLRDTPYLFKEKVFYKGDRIPNRRNPIFVLKPWEVPDKGVTPRHVIRYPDGSAAFVIAW
ncbi:MAG: hypothetical protein ACREAA_22080 [Candidatus Polarisedimenticolia bacterium]